MPLVKPYIIIFTIEKEVIFVLMPIYTIKPVLRGHLWEEKKVVF